MDTATQIVLEMHRHSNWANQRLLDATGNLSTEQLHTPLGEGSIGNLFETLVHIYGAQKLWFERMNTGIDQKEVTTDELPSIEALAFAWSDLDVAQEAYLAGCNAEELSKSIRVHFGDEFEAIGLADMLLQQALHAQQHRGEVALILTQLGHSPGDLDFIEYVDSVRDQ